MKTDVLLSTAFFLRNDGKQTRKMRPYPPLTALYTAAVLRSRGLGVALFDATLADGEAELDAALGRHRPSLVAFCEDNFNFLSKMCLSHARDAAMRMIATSRARGATVIAAGADATLHPEAYLAAGAQWCIIGETERTLAELAEVLLDHAGRAPEAVAGLAFPDPRRDGGILFSARRERERHLDRLPLPAWDLVEIERYRSAWRRVHGYFSLNLAASRGCPYRCDWCAKPIWGDGYAQSSPARVAEEMAWLQNRFAPDHLWFADDVFGLHPAWVKEFAGAVAGRAVRLPFTIQSRADLLTDEVVADLARAGCDEVWLGAESGSQRILDLMEKGLRVGQILAARRRLRRAGIRACYFIQFGYPGETFRDIQATVRMVRQSLPDDIGVSVSYPLPGTPFHARVRSGLGRRTHWRDSDDLAVLYRATYRSPFYKKLHRVLHRDVELRRRLTDAGGGRARLLPQLDRLNAEWLRLGQLESACRNSEPTTLAPARRRAPGSRRPGRAG